MDFRLSAQGLVRRLKNKILALWPQLPDLQHTNANLILIIIISNSDNLNKFWVRILTRQGLINQVY